MLFVCCCSPSLPPLRQSADSSALHAIFCAEIMADVDSIVHRARSSLARDRQALKNGQEGGEG